MENFTQTETGPESTSFLKKWFNLYLSPNKTFTAIDSKPDWLLPLITLAIITILISYLTMHVLHEAILQQIMEQQGISYNEAAGMIPSGFVKYSTIVGGFVGIWIASFALSGFFYLVYQLVLGGHSTYKKTLSVYCYISLAIGFVGGIIRTVLILSTKKAEIYFGPASFLSLDMKNSILFRVLAQFDFFIIWQLVLLFLGYGILFKFPKAKSATVMLCLWGLYVVGVVSLGSLFQGGLGR